MLQLPAIFSDDMVLQRGKNVAIWGETDRTSVTLSFAGQLVDAVVQNGKFQALLAPMDAGGPYELQIRAFDDRADETAFDELTYRNIMMGEVWLAGGQSNMELELQNSQDGAEIVKGLDNPLIRFYYTPKVPYVGDKLAEAEAESHWDLCTPEAAGRWSAVGYYFAKKLAEELDVTVGIIGCNWGGTSASCWMSREALENDRRISRYIEEYDEIVENQDPEEYIRAREAYLVYQAEFDKNVGHYYETAENPTWGEALELFGENQYPGPMGPRSELRPCGLYETMLQRVCPYTLAGFLYYQGEEDDHRPDTYYELLHALVQLWRKDWGDDELPFMLVQLPMFQAVDEKDYQNWPLIREAQMRLFQTVKNTGIAVILDQGEYGNIHPTKKDSVGYRLADQALYLVYARGREEDIFGPIYHSYQVDGKRMILNFAYAGQGICCKADTVAGFEIAGEDQIYHPAEAEISGNKIAIWAENVPKPMYARYCWTNYREVSLFGANGLPVAPFRTSMKDGAVATGSRNTGEFE